MVDHSYRVDGLDVRAARTRFRERCVSPGGMVATALAQAAALGCPTQLLSAIGDDPDGRVLRRSLRALGVGTAKLLLRAETPTTVAVVLVAARGGERRFIVPDRRALERAAPDFDLGAIRRGALLLVDGHFPRQALRAVRRARQVGARVVGDFSRPSPVARRLLPYVDFPIVPSEFADEYTQGDVERALRRLREEFGGTPVVTQGARGGVYLGGERVRRYRARRVAVRDTTGCGDVFHGAFAAGLCRGLELEASIALAARAASVSCTALGATTRLLKTEDLE